MEENTVENNKVAVIRPDLMDRLQALAEMDGGAWLVRMIEHMANEARPPALAEERLKMVMRFMPKEEKALAKAEKAVKNRLADFRKQKMVLRDSNQDVLGGANKFGARRLPRTLEEPERMESVYRIRDILDDKGRQMSHTVTLMVWADWSCQQAVAWNKGMVGKVCGENDANFSTRMQTEVQTRAVLMWLQLKGEFFWDDTLKSYSTSLYFEGEKRILRRIQSEEFKSWLQNHCDINPGRADFEYLMNEINAIAFNPEVSRGVMPRALFNRRRVGKDDFIYISSGDSYMYKIGAAKDGENILKVPNGTDGVVFLNGQTLSPWELQDGEGVDPFTTFAPFSTANYESKFGPMIARLWLLSIAACQAAFPGILFTGKARSGKTRFAKAVCELFGTKHRSASIDPGSAGKKDFWTIVNVGGIVNFDNVDTRIDWFGDAMQQACTDGSFESRTLFKDGEITTLKSNARIILTANNPLFAAEAGLSDRLQIVRLLPFDGGNGKEVADSSLTDGILENRDQALTWLARTISRALADKEPVETNVCFRHPDFADFALRCSRALSDGDGNMYPKAVMALKSAEFDKALLTIQASKAKLIYEALVYFFNKKAPAGGLRVWIGRATQMLELILESHPELKNKDDEASRQAPSASSVGYYLDKYLGQFAVVFDIEEPNKRANSGTEYTFKGFSAAYKMCISETSPKRESDDNYDEDLPF